MSEFDRIRRFYFQELTNDLGELHRARARLYLNGGLAVLAASASLLVPKFASSLSREQTVLVASAGLVGAALMAYLTVRRWKRLNDEYESRVGGKLLGLLGSGCSRPRERAVEHSHLGHDGIFQGDGARLSGSDLLIWDAPHRLTSACVEIRPASGAGKMFGGRIYSVELHAQVVGEIQVVSKSAYAKRSWVRTAIRRRFKDSDRISLSDPKFDDHFVVFTSLPSDARRLLSLNMRKRMIELSRKFKAPLYFSWRGSSATLGVDGVRSVFRPNLLGAVLEFDELRKFFEEIQFAREMAERSQAAHQNQKEQREQREQEELRERLASLERKVG